MKTIKVQLPDKLREWDRYYMGIAKSVSENSKCYARQIGAVIVKDKVIICTGYNGPPRGMSSCSERNDIEGSAIVGGGYELNYERYKHDLDYLVNFGAASKEGICPRLFMNYKSGEGLEWCPAAHAEANAVFQAARLGINVVGAKIYMTCGVPCINCMNAIIQSGIRFIICDNLNLYNGTNEQTWDWYLNNVDIIIRDTNGNYLVTRHFEYFDGNLWDGFVEDDPKGPGPGWEFCLYNRQGE